MPYLQTVKFGDFDVVCGFEPPSFDPVATQAVIFPLLADTDEYKKLVAVKDHILVQHTLRREIWPQWKASVPGTKEYNDYQVAYNAAAREIQELQTQARDLDSQVEEHRRRLVESNGVRFETAGVTEIDEITSESLTTKLRDLQVGKKLLADGSTIADKIGTEYWTTDGATWTLHKIVELDVDVPESGAYLFDDLSAAQHAEIDAQLERERIVSLSPELREQEKQLLLGQVLTAAGIKKSEFEIMGVDDPLAAAQAWYAEQVAIIEERYTIS